MSRIDGIECEGLAKFAKVSLYIFIFWTICKLVAYYIFFILGVLLGK